MNAGRLGSFSSLTVKASKTDKAKPQEDSADASDASGKTTGANETVNMTVKLTRADWERVGELRFTHRLPFQKIAIAGLNLYLKKLGQPPLQTPEVKE